MGCHGGFSLDEAIRRSWFKPEKVLEDAGLLPGMVFVDVGCGEGFYTLLAAEMVGSKGIIYALDSDSSAIYWLRRKAEAKGFSNVKPWWQGLKKPFSVKGAPTLCSIAWSCTIFKTP